MLAWDIKDWLSPPSGTPEKEPGYLFPDGYSCSLGGGCPPPAVVLGQGFYWDSQNCPIPAHLECLSGQPAFRSGGANSEGVVNEAALTAYWNRNGWVCIKTGPIHSKLTSNPANWRMQLNRIVSYYRPGLSGIPIPKYQPGQSRRVLPLDKLPINIPALDPNSQPIGVPVPTPNPIPVPMLPGIKPNPDRVPSERPDNGPEPKPDPWSPPEPVSPFPPEKPFPPNPRPDPGENPKPPVDPYVPSVDIDTGAISNNPWITPRPGRHYKRPPGSNEREKKTKKNPGAFYRILNGIVGFAGEAGDLVGAVYDALPKSETRWKGRDGKWRDRDYGPIEKAQRIYNNLDKLDVDKAIENIIANEAEDRLIGGLASGARKNLARKGWGDPNRNPFGTPSQLPDLPPIPNLK